MATRVQEILPDGRRRELPQRDPQGQRRPPQQPSPRRRGLGERLGLVMLALLSLAIAVPGWVRGARYTVEGWAILAQAVANVLGAPVRVGLPGGWVLVGLVLGVGAAYSLAEVAARPRGAWLRWRIIVFVTATAVWLAVLGTDIGTTIIGVLNTPATAWAPERWIAERPIAAAIYGALLTFYPEGLTLLAGFLARTAFR